MEKELTRTLGQLQEVDRMVASLYATDTNLEKSKFGYAYKRFTDKNYVPLIKEFQEKIEMIRVEHALTDKDTQEVLVDRMNARGFKYSREGLKAVIEDERKLVKEFDAKEVKINPYISSYVPKDLTEEQRGVLKGLVI